VKLSVILSDAETTKVRRDSGELDPLMLKFLNPGVMSILPILHQTIRE
jgi:hypothetical protein